ncbi:MAG: hypothetical protein SXG53_21390 [Pseudomonadota bacterium]|nr:hypothetical protein [Pseudomonadota bacterium]
MAKASILLPNGTKVDIDGSAEEVASLLRLYGEGGKEELPGAKTQVLKVKRPRRNSARRGEAKAAGAAKAGVPSTDPTLLAQIANIVKTCEEAEAIEEKILDKTSQVDRTLLPLYIVHDYFKNEHGLTSGDINKITTQLGIPISTANASNTLSGTASRYVMADSVRKQGVPVRYKLTRRGQKYVKAVITGQASEDAE